MTKLEDYIIQNTYQPTEEEQHAIAELEAKGIDPKDWESKKKGIVSFKDNMREFMYYEQNCRCAYCRIEIPIACCFLQREHIVPKTPYPKWMFLPRNLCFTCDRCNNNKNDDEVLVNPNTTEYPTESDEFLIVNPFIDRYSDHIELKDGILYVGKTDKGRFTITTCHLYNLEYALERAKQKMRTDNPETVMAQLLSLLQTTDSTAEEIARIKLNLVKIVNMYKMDQR